MDALSEHENERIIAHLEELADALEADISVKTFYMFAILAHDFTGKKKAPLTLAHIHRCVALSARMVAIRQLILPYPGHWSPVTDVLKVVQSETNRLASLYGVARPQSRQQRLALQAEFRATFLEKTGKPYQAYEYRRTAKAAATITSFWREAFAAALERFTHDQTVENLDRLMACLPAWAASPQGRLHKHSWSEPSVKEVMQVFHHAVQVCELCATAVTEIASTVLELAPIVDPDQITREVEQQHAAQIQELRDKLHALPLPKDTPQAQKAQLRKDKAQLNEALKALLSAQQATIQSQVNRGMNYRNKLSMLGKKASGERETLVRRVGKESIDVLSRIIWIYDYKRQGGETWAAADYEAKAFMRALRKARVQAVAGAST